MDISIPEGAEVWVTYIDSYGTEIMQRIIQPLSNIKIINPEVEQV